MTCTNRSVGLYVASETSDVIWGRLTAQGSKAVVSCEGSHSLADSILSGDDFVDARALGAVGFVVVRGDLSQTTTQGTFGNDTAQTRIGQLRTFIQGTTAPITAKAGKVHLIGGSGGCTDAINYARANPANVASMFLICPLVDVEDFYSNWTNSGANGTAPAPSGITQSEINKAYNAGVDDGGTAYTAAMPAHNPSRTGNQAALSGIPIKLAYSDNDPFIPVSKVTGYATLVNAAGGTAVAYSQGPVGHTGAGVNPLDLVGWLVANP